MENDDNNPPLFYVLFLRHGFSIANLAKALSHRGVLWLHGSPRTCQSVKNEFCTDAALTAPGREQGRAAGRRVSKTLGRALRLHHAEVFSSGLTRAVQTAEEFVLGSDGAFQARATPLPFIGERRVRACGCLVLDRDNEVQSLEKIRARVGRGFSVVPWPVPLAAGCHGWEEPDLDAFQTTVVPLLATRAQTTDSNAVVVVSHKKTLKQLLGLTLRNGEMAVQGFDPATGRLVGPATLLDGYKIKRTTVHQAFRSPTNLQSAVSDRVDNPLVYGTY